MAALMGRATKGNSRSLELRPAALENRGKTTARGTPLGMTVKARERPSLTRI